MKYSVCLVFLLSFFPLTGAEIETPAIRGPKLTASDLAWVQGIKYVKGRLPNEAPFRLGSVALILKYANGKTKTLIEPIGVRYYEGMREDWKEVVGELLVSVRVVNGQHEFFLGYTTAEQSTFKKREIKLRGLGLPGIAYEFQGQTGGMVDDLSFVVPAGESELFVFVQNGEPFARVSLIAVASDDKSAL